MNPNKLKFTSKENPSEEEIAELRESLRAYNRKVAGGTEYSNLMYSVKDEKANLLGGIFGKISWGWLYIDLLWVDDSLRGAGVGTQLIQGIEKLANERGIFRYYLSTTSFQALDFYKKMGYEVCGEIDDLPIGHINYFLKKVDV